MTDTEILDWCARYDCFLDYVDSRAESERASLAIYVPAHTPRGTTSHRWSAPTIREVVILAASQYPPAADESAVDTVTQIIGNQQQIAEILVHMQTELAALRKRTEPQPAASDNPLGDSK